MHKTLLNKIARHLNWAPNKGIAPIGVSAICVLLCFAEMTLVRAQSKSGKRHKVRRYSREVAASGPSRPEASSTKVTNRLASSILAARSTERPKLELLLVYAVINSKRLSRNARGWGDHPPWFRLQVLPDARPPLTAFAPRGRGELLERWGSIVIEIILWGVVSY